MNSSIPNSSDEIDCPACGAPAESGLAIASLGVHGMDSSCLCCDFFVWQGAVVMRGTEITREDVIRIVRERAPGLSDSEAYREPSDRRSLLTLRFAQAEGEPEHPSASVPDVVGREVSSITVRFARSRDLSETTR